MSCATRQRVANFPINASDNLDMTTTQTPETRLTALRQTCLDILLDIETMERGGEYATKRWHQAQDALGRALRHYRDAGATHHDMYTLEAGGRMSMDHR